MVEPSADAPFVTRKLVQAFDMLMPATRDAKIIPAIFRVLFIVKYHDLEAGL